MICKIHELKKAFSRFNDFQKFRGFLLCDEENLYFCSIDEAMSYAFKVEVEDSENQAYLLTYENINSLIDYFKTIRVRRNCRVLFKENSLVIEIEEKDGNFTPSLNLLVSKALPEEEEVLKELFLTKEKGQNLNVNDFILFTKLVTLRKKDSYFPASQFINVLTNDKELILSYGYDESIIRCKIPCETNNVSRETFDYDFVKLLNDLFKETLSSRANILFKNKYLFIDADTFVAVGKSVQKDYLDLNLLMDRIKCSETEMYDFPCDLMNELSVLNKEKEKTYNKQTLKLHGKTTKIVKTTVSHTLEKFLIYFENENETFKYNILSMTFENLPDGYYYKADKIYRYLKGNEDVRFGFGKSGSMFITKGNVDLLLLAQYEQ